MRSWGGLICPQDHRAHGGRAGCSDRRHPCRANGRDSDIPAVWPLLAISLPRAGRDAQTVAAPSRMAQWITRPDPKTAGSPPPRRPGWRRRRGCVLSPRMTHGAAGAVHKVLRIIRAGCCLLEWDPIGKPATAPAYLTTEGGASQCGSGGAGSVVARQSTGRPARALDGAGRSGFTPGWIPRPTIGRGPAAMLATGPRREL